MSTTASSSSSLVSIGLPVYNGEEFLCRALDALLAQDHANFELIISDNASTDRTEAICRAYAACDERIRYIRQVDNQGAIENFNLVLYEARGEFFIWAAHDDCWSPRFISACVEQLQRDPSASLCHPYVQSILPNGKFYGGVERGYEIERNGPQGRRAHVRSVLTFWGSPNVIYGVMRHGAVARVRPLQACAMPDRLFLAEMAMQGRFLTVPEVLMWKHIIPERAEMPPDEYVRYLEYLGLPKKRILPLFNRLTTFRLFLQGVRYAKFSSIVRRQMALDVIALYLGRHYWLSDVKESVAATVGTNRYYRVVKPLKKLLRGEA